MVDYVISMALYSECSRSTCGPGATVAGGAAWAIVGAIAALIAFAITSALVRVVGKATAALSECASVTAPRH
jgi:amino acid permease